MECVANFSLRSAKGAKYDSQGQARSASPLGKKRNDCEALKERNKGDIFRTFRAPVNWFLLTRGDALRGCPWLSYFAPLALRRLKFRAFGAAEIESDF